jgi:sRNA-binding carbon storage regulator CsrA
MLCLTCKADEGFLIGKETKVTFGDARNGKVKVRIDAPQSIIISRLDRHGERVNPVDQLRKALKLKKLSKALTTV